MSSFSFILLIFWLAVFGMVFGSSTISEISWFIFCAALPITLIMGIKELIRNRGPHQ